MALRIVLGGKGRKRPRPDPDDEDSFGAGISWGVGVPSKPKKPKQRGDVLDAIGKTRGYQDLINDGDFGKTEEGEGE
jgi:hypothetical protein